MCGMETVEREMNNSMQRYVDILSEAGFKAVFGEERNKDVLVDLLNIILPAGRTIREISYATTEIPGFTLANISTISSRDVLNMLQKYMIQGQIEGTDRNMNCRRCILSP